MWHGGGCAAACHAHPLSASFMHLFHTNSSVPVLSPHGSDAGLSGCQGRGALVALGCPHSAAVASSALWAMSLLRGLWLQGFQSHPLAFLSKSWSRLYIKSSTKCNAKEKKYK